MSAQLTSSPFLISSIVFLFLGITLSIAGMASLFRAQIRSFTLQTFIGILMIFIGIISGSIAFGIQGYHALTHEEVAANISVSPIAPQRFTATMRYPDGKISNYIIAGDEIYIDAHILKWQPIANLFGLHTAYELDRIGGRYRDIEQERNAERTLNALYLEKPVNLFTLRQRHTSLAILVDAKYGSATFIPVSEPAELELRVSTTGLLLREITSNNKKK